MSAHTKPAVLCCGVGSAPPMSIRFTDQSRICSHKACCFVLWCESSAPPLSVRLRNKVTFVSAHTKPAALNLLALGLAEKSIPGLTWLAVPTHAGSACLSGAIERAYCCNCVFHPASKAVATTLLLRFCCVLYCFCLSETDSP